MYRYHTTRDKDKKDQRKTRYKTVPLHTDTYLLLKNEKEKLEKNFGRTISWDELIYLLFEFKKMIVKDE